MSVKVGSIKRQSSLQLYCRQPADGKKQGHKKDKEEAFVCGCKCSLLHLMLHLVGQTHTAGFSAGVSHRLRRHSEDFAFCSSLSFNSDSAARGICPGVSL